MRNILTALCLLLGICTSIFAQDGKIKKTLILDLANESVGSFTHSISEGNYVLIIKNLLPKEYDIKVEIEDEEILPFVLPAAVEQSSLAGCPCDGFNALLEQIEALDSESLLPPKRNELESALVTCEACTDKYQYAVSMLSKFDHRYEVIDLKKSQILKVRISRKNVEGKELKWIRTFKTPSRGKWLTTYSFNFITTQWGSKEEFYFAKSIEMDEFEITMENNKKWVNFVPSITFTWLSGKRLYRTWACGGSAGIGFDLEKPVVFLGASIIYNQNLSLTLGYAAHQVKQLNGKYNEGDIIKENLTPDQLLNDQYRFNPFISLSLRFDRNPFKLGKPAEKEQKE